MDNVTLADLLFFDVFRFRRRSHIQAIVPVAHESCPHTIFIKLFPAKAAEGTIDVVLLDLLVRGVVRIRHVIIFPCSKCLLLEMNLELVVVEVGLGVWVEVAIYSLKHIMAWSSWLHFKLIVVCYHQDDQKPNGGLQLISFSLLLWYCEIIPNIIWRLSWSMRMTVAVCEASFYRVVHIMYVFKHDECANNIRVVLILNVGLYLLFYFLNSVNVFIFNCWAALFEKPQDIPIVEKQINFHDADLGVGRE